MQGAFETAGVLFIKTLKNGIGLLALLLSVNPVRADNWLQTCTVIESLAKDIMQSRQQGVTVPELVNALKLDNERGQRLYWQMINRAYDFPRYPLQEKQQKAIGEFANQVFVECVASIQSRKSRQSGE